MSMPEMPHPGEHHRRARCVGGGDHLGVAHRSARLDDRGRAGFDGRNKAVGEREEGVGGDDRASGARLGASPRSRPPPRPCARRGAPNRPATSARRRRQRSRRPWRRRWRSTSRAWRPSRRTSGPPFRLGVGARLVTTLSAPSSSAPLSRSWTRRPPATDRTASVDRPGSGSAPAIRSRRFRLAATIASASSSASGAMITSVNISTILRALGPSSRRLSAMTPPNAETGSQASAFS